MYLKAGMFVVIGVVSAGLIIGARPELQTFLLMALVIWSFCRAYYFAFYVIERYVDPSFRFSGLCSAIKYLLQARKLRNRPR
jgi:hypothetical protein